MPYIFNIKHRGQLWHGIGKTAAAEEGQAGRASTAVDEVIEKFKI
jgi:hypothetical protein